MMFTGKTKSGFVYCIPEKRIRNMELLDALTELETNGAALPEVLKLLLDDDAVLTRRRPVMAPGEMEELKLTKDMLDAHPGLTRIHITVEEA